MSDLEYEMNVLETRYENLMVAYTMLLELGVEVDNLPSPHINSATVLKEIAKYHCENMRSQPKKKMDKTSAENLRQMLRNKTTGPFNEE